MKHLYILLCIGLSFFPIACSTDSPSDMDEETSIEPVLLETYFPAIDSDVWETLTMEELEWNVEAERPLYDFLDEKGTKAFIILYDGRLVVEYYFGQSTKADNHAWNSAAKTLTAWTVGIAQEEGFLSLEDSSSQYLGEGWSRLTVSQEANISVKNHLTMTTGLDYTVSDIFCTDAECLTYKNDPDEFWFYHNAPYTLLGELISGATGVEFKQYFTDKLRDRIGMQGLWVNIGFNNVFFSNARSMARFGLLNLTKGVWDGAVILEDTRYLEAMTQTSQIMNPAYGYLWWLNGKSSFRVPGSELEFQGKLIPNAPDDLYAGLGKNDQKLYVVPSKKLVVVRLGEDGGETLLGPSGFDNELWGLITDLTEQ